VTLQGYISSFKLQYTLDGITWLSHENGRIYESTKVYNTIYKTDLYTPITALAVRINPYSWSLPPNWPEPISPPCTRAEVYILNPVTMLN